MRGRTVVFSSPLKGIWTAGAGAEQPRDTTPDCLNVLPFDRTGRTRVSSRPGLTLLATVGSGPIRAIHQTSFVSGSNKLTVLVVVSGNRVYTSTDLSTFIQRGTLASSSGQCQICSGRGRVFLVDNGIVKVIDLATMTLDTLTASEEKGTVPSPVSLCAVWRDRLVLAGPDHQWYMSRCGDYYDWLYAQDDVGTAIAGQSAGTTVPGGIADPIVALIPLSDDRLLMGQDHSFYQMLGDPGAGGTINNISETVGICGPSAWARDAGGRLWIVGTGGIFAFDGVRLRPESDPNLFTVLTSIHRTDHLVSMAWDRRNQALWIFISPNDSGVKGTHVVLDGRFGGLWPQQYPTGTGPVCCGVYDGDDPDDRFVLLGGWSGQLYHIDPTKKADNQTAIPSYVYIGPQQPAGQLGNAMLSGGDLMLGEDDGGGVDVNCKVTIQAGPTSAAALTSPSQSRSVTFTTAGRQEFPYRITGNTFFLKLENSTNAAWWSFDRLVMDATPAGINR